MSLDFLLKFFSLKSILHSNVQLLKSVSQWTKFFVKKLQKVLKIRTWTFFIQYLYTKVVWVSDFSVLDIGGYTYLPKWSSFQMFNSKVPLNFFLFDILVRFGANLLQKSVLLSYFICRLGLWRFPLTTKTLRKIEFFRSFVFFSEHFGAFGVSLEVGCCFGSNCGCSKWLKHWERVQKLLYNA